MNGAAWSPRGAAYAASPVHRAGPSLARLEALLRPLPGDRACDLGCGAGATTLRWADAGCAEVVGVDVAEGMLAAARKAAGARTNVRFVHTDAADTGLPGAAFDLVSARHTLHHHADPDATLREAARLLRPGGRFAFVDEVALGDGLDAWYDALERTRDPSHGGCRALPAWREAVEAAGLAWVVGDAETRYRLDLRSWLERVDADAARRAEVHRLLDEAPPGAARRLRFEHASDGTVAAFAMPMAIALATRPLDSREAPSS